MPSGTEQKIYDKPLGYLKQIADNRFFQAPSPSYKLHKMDLRKYIYSIHSFIYSTNADFVSSIKIPGALDAMVMELPILSGKILLFK